jgi:hypothetical protein
MNRQNTNMTRDTSLFVLFFHLTNVNFKINRENVILYFRIDNIDISAILIYVIIMLIAQYCVFI